MCGETLYAGYVGYYYIIEINADYLAKLRMVSTVVLYY